MPDQRAEVTVDDPIGWWSETYGLHRHRWLHEPEENFVPTALRATIPKHVNCRPLTFADA